jgi:hypothetical protein
VLPMQNFKAIGFVNPIIAPGRDIPAEVGLIKSKANSLSLDLIDIYGWGTMDGEIPAADSIKKIDAAFSALRRGEAEVIIVSMGKGVYILRDWGKA